MYYKVNKLHSLLLILAVILTSGIVFIIIAFTVDNSENNIALQIFNWIGVIFNVLENFPLGFNIIYLIKNHISEKFTLIGATVGIVNVIVWFSWAMYSVLVNGSNLYHSIIANFLAICLHITQFVIFFYNRKYETAEENNGQINASSTIGDDSISEDEKENIINKEEEKNEPSFMKEFL